MRIALTGTPGTGKTTIAGLLPYTVIDLNSLVKDGLNVGVDPDRGCLEADMDGLEKRLASMDTEDLVILEGHFSHYFADEAIVLRLNPLDLEKRLAARGYSRSKIQENLESEALDVILIEAVEFCKKVNELDTTGKSVQEVANLVVRVLRKEITLEPGQVDWMEDFFDPG
jgi:adenylate kinase